MRLNGLQSSGEWNGSASVCWRNSDMIIKLETLNCSEEGDEGMNVDKDEGMNIDTDEDMNIDKDEDMLGVDKEGNKEGDVVS